MSDLRIRIISAAVFAIVMFGGLLLGPIPYAIVISLVGGFSLAEYFNITKHWKEDNVGIGVWYKVFGIGLAMVFFASSYFIASPELNQMYGIKLFALIPLFILGLMAFELLAHSSTPFQNIGLNLTGILYVGLPLFFANFIAFHGGEYEPWQLLGVMILIWGNDVFAYLVGSAIGKRKLLPRISPKKSVEGFVGGIIGSIGLGVVGFLLFDFYTLYDWVVLALVASVCGTIGDLIISMLKRSLHIKDTGTVMPGHGGFLDRFDAMFFALPFAAIYLLIFA